MIIIDVQAKQDLQYLMSLKEVLIGAVLKTVETLSQPDLYASSTPYMASPHKKMMPYLWTFVIDFSLFFALYKHTKYSVVLHSITASFVGLTTLITALPVLIELGIPDHESSFRLQRHSILGIIIISVIILQVLLGAVSRTLQFLTFRSSLVIFRINLLHRCLGYTLIIVGKIQAYLMIAKVYDNDFFWGLMISDIILIILLLVRKITWPNISSKIVPHNASLQKDLLKDIKEIRSRYPKIGIFANYIYDLSPLEKLHPIGYKIVESVMDRELDRYLYGMYRSEREPSVPTNNHGYRALALVGNPIGKIDIPSVYTGLQTDFINVKISKVRELSAKGEIYEASLASDGDEEFQYRGYSQVQQLGRYFALTLNKKITRLYTTVGFLTQKNINFMKEEFFKNLSIEFQHVSKSQLGSSLSIPILNDSERRGVKLMVKKYPTGELSSTVIDSSDEHLQLSASRGQGLRFGDLKRGKIIIIAGGTGLFPFCDLIDLLFKSILLSKEPRLRSTIQINDPLLKLNPFKGFNFELYISMSNIEDIHPLIRQQLNELVKDPNFFQLTLREMREGQTKGVLHENVKLTSERFSKIISDKIQEGQFEKIYVCGPPRMNEEMISIIDKNSLDPQKYVIL